jgi:hypothetical protein
MPRRLIGLSRLWPGACLLALAAALHSHQLRGQRTYLRDTYRFYVPAKHYLAEMLARNELPQWWPWDGLGSPFLAQPMFSVFHPSTLLYRVLPFWTAFAAQDLLITLLALFGTYALARVLRQPPIAALVAATLFASCGYMVGLTEHTFMKLSAATMPWYFAALIVAFRRGGPWLPGPTAVFGLLLLGGDPQVAILAAVGGVAIALAEESTPRSTALALLSPLLGAGAAAVQVLPSLLLAGQTQRATSPTGLDQWPLDASHLLGLVAPISTEGFAFHMWFGIAGLALAAAGVAAARRDRPVTALVGLTILSAWLALGHGYGLNDLFRYVVPTWGKLRYPIKSIVLGMLSMSLLAGEGFQHIRLERARPSARIGIAAGALFATLAFVALLPSSGLAGAIVRLTPGILVAAAVLLLPESPSVAGVAAALVIMEAAWVAVASLPTVPPAFYAEPPMVTALHREGVGLTGPAFDRLDDHDFNALNEPFFGSQAGGGWNSLYGAVFDLPSLTSYMPGTSLRLRRAWDSSVGPPIFARLAGTFGVGYIVESSQLAKAGSAAIGADRIVLTEPVFGYTAFHLRHSLPRAYAVRRARVVSGPEEAGTILRDASFRPGREILVEGSTPNPDWSSQPEEPAVEATITSRTNASVSIEANLPWSGFVVLNEAYFPGWTATIDGRDTIVLVANGFVRAVEAPPGLHRIEMRYQTPGLRAGLIVSCTTFLALALGWFVLARRVRVSQAEHPTAVAA